MKLIHCKYKSGLTSLGGLSILLLLMAGAGLTTPVAAQGYHFTALGTPGGAISAANAISNTGQITGLTYAAGTYHSRATLWDASGPVDLGTLGGDFGSGMAINQHGQVAGFGAGGRAALWQNGRGFDLGTLGGAHSYASGINNAGQVVGQSYIDSDNVAFHAALWQGNTVLDLGTLGGRFSAANGINNGGQVVGQASTANNSSVHATLWSNGTVLDLGTLGGNFSSAMAISDNGYVVGHADVSPASVTGLTGLTSMHATLWQNGKIHDLGVLAGGMESAAKAVNMGGQVVGYSFYGGGMAPHAMLWHNGTMLDLNSMLSAEAVQAGWVLVDASGINDFGAIVGSALNTRTGANRAYLLSPVPEPGTWALMLAGLGAMLLGVRRHRQRLAGG